MTPGCGSSSCGDAGAGGYSEETPGFSAAFPVTSRSVRVKFHHRMLAWGTLRADDTCNPRKWLVSSASNAETFKVIRVDKVAPGVFDVTLDRNLHRYDVEHTVTVSGVLTCSRDDMVGSVSASFNGMSHSKPRRDSDLLNQTGVNEEAAVYGTLATHPDGDIRHHSGEALTRKIVMRYVFARKDSYKRLYPTFRGVMPPLKTFVTTSDLVSIRSELLSALTREVSPDITVKVGFNTEGTAVVVTVDGRIHTLVME